MSFHRNDTGCPAETTCHFRVIELLQTSQNDMSFFIPQRTTCCFGQTTKLDLLLYDMSFLHNWKMTLQKWHVVLHWRHHPFLHEMTCRFYCLLPSAKVVFDPLTWFKLSPLDTILGRSNCRFVINLISLWSMTRDGNITREDPPHLGRGWGAMFGDGDKILSPKVGRVRTGKHSPPCTVLVPDIYI